MKDCKNTAIELLDLTGCGSACLWEVEEDGPLSLRLALSMQNSRTARTTQKKGIFLDLINTLSYLSGGNINIGRRKSIAVQ